MKIRKFAGAVIYIAGLVTVVAEVAGENPQPVVTTVAAAAMLLGWIIENYEPAN